MRKNNPANDIHFTSTRPHHRTPSPRPTAVLDAMPPKLRPVSTDRVARMSDQVTASGVLEHLAQWRRQDNPRSASARTAVSDRAVLVGLLILSGEDSPLQISQLAELFEYRIDSEARQLLGLPTHSDADGRPRRAGRWAGSTARAFHRLLAVLDPFPQSIQQPVSYTDIAHILAAHDSDREKVMKLRLDTFTQSLVQITFNEQPAQYRDSSQRIDIAIADYMVRSESQHTFAREKLAAAVENETGATTVTKRIVDVFAGPYLAFDEPLIQTRASHRSRYGWGREVSVAVRVDSRPAARHRFPALIVSATLHLPMQDFEPTAMTLMRGALQTGLRPGTVDADRAYFTGSRTEAVHKSTFALGFTPSTDYRRGQLGVSFADEGMVWVEGKAYCPQMPRMLVTATQDYTAGKITETVFRTCIQARTKYALRPLGKPNKQGAVRMICRFLHSVPSDTSSERAAARQVPDGTHGLCAQKPIVVPESICLRRQAFTYASPQWEGFHVHSRATAEQVTAHLRPKDFTRSGVVSGFAATQLFLAISVMTYNLRQTARFVASS